MPKLRLGPKDIVEHAGFKVAITLERGLEGSYSTDEIATTTIRIPIGSEAGAGQVVIGKTLVHLIESFEAVYGPIDPPRPVEVATETDDTVTADPLPF